MLGKTEWWGVIENYNQAIFPMQLIVMVIGFLIIGYMIFGKEKAANAMLKAYLSACNVWIGIIFFIVLGKGFPSPMNYSQGSLFIIIGILFFVDIFKKKIQFQLPDQMGKKIVTIALLGFVACYPLVGIVMGHEYSMLIYPGTLPCATTALALVLLTMAMPRINFIIYILLLVWAIPFPPLVQIPKYQVYEDSIMFVIGIYALMLLIFNLRKRHRNNLKKYKEIFQIKKDATFATVSKEGEANIIAIHSKHLLSSSRVLISDQFMKKTKANVIENPYGTLSIIDRGKLYKISGECKYRTSGFLYKMAVRGAKKYAETQAKNKDIKINCKGIVLLSVDSFEVQEL